MEYWCEVCDRNQVKINEPETGKFYSVYGESRIKDEPCTVTFAVCKDCNVKDAIHEVTWDTKLRWFSRTS